MVVHLHVVDFVCNSCCHNPCIDISFWGSLNCLLSDFIVKAFFEPVNEFLVVLYSCLFCKYSELVDIVVQWSSILSEVMEALDGFLLVVVWQEDCIQCSEEFRHGGELELTADITILEVLGSPWSCCCFHVDKHVEDTCMSIRVFAWL